MGRFSVCWGRHCHYTSTRPCEGRAHRRGWRKHQSAEDSSGLNSLGFTLLTTTGFHPHVGYDSGPTSTPFTTRAGKIRSETSTEDSTVGVKPCGMCSNLDAPRALRIGACISSARNEL